MNKLPCLENIPHTIKFTYDEEDRVCLAYIDQRTLPQELVFKRAYSWQQVAHAIAQLAVRGAPAIGVAGAAGLALWAIQESNRNNTFCGQLSANKKFEGLHRVADSLIATRPTAVNLAWGVRHMAEAIETCHTLYHEQDFSSFVFAVVKHMEEEDEATNRLLGRNGAALIHPGSCLLTHCNAGSLATVFYGTALGVVYEAAAQGKVMRVFADETRPVCQGARLTAWELSRAQIPCTLICDDMAASLMSQHKVDAVVVGADRIASNGDTANKIGTYGLAILAHYHNIPFYVVAPSSTIDPTLENGLRIVLEQRASTEVQEQALAGVEVWNPAFDLTPASLISAIVTERGVFKPDELVY